MRASEILRARVRDIDGRDCGPVRDLRVARTSDGRFRVTGIVLGDGRLARLTHSLGTTDGRADGPWLLRRLTADAERRARFVPARHVSSWGAKEIRLACRYDALERFRGAEAGQ